ncbi:MAG: TVP38/TMEM64 family protein [Alphaproteobacteria bacterium]|nr:TVP38/TMEM64 family protein [Alphaproteobacteria bacterium]
MTNDDPDATTDVTAAAAPPAAQKSTLRTWAPLIVIVAIMALVFAMGWHKYLTLEQLGRNYATLNTFIADHLLLSILAYAALYIAVVALSLPGALALTLSGGLLFGWQIGGPVTVIAATIGATVIFLVAKTSLGETLAAKAGPAVNKLRKGFQENALSYLLFLRLVPAFPFFVVNLAPALLGVPLRTYVIGTAIGIIPGTMAFSFAASQLGTVIEKTNAEHAACVAEKGEAACPYVIDAGTLVSKEIILAFAAIGVVALIPVIVKKWSNRHAAA